MGDKKRVNGALYSKNSAVLDIEGEVFEGWATAEFGDKIEAPFSYGASKHGGPRGTPEGRYTPDPLVVGFQLDTARDVRNKLAGLSPDGKSIGKARVTITLTFDETVLGVGQMQFETCRLTEIGNSVEDSAEGTLEKHTFLPLRILRDGQSLFDQSAPGA